MAASAEKKAPKKGTPSSAGEKSKRGGRRPGAGRKPKQVATLGIAPGAALIPDASAYSNLDSADKEAAANEALGLFVAIMRDPALGVTTRMEAADKVMLRVWGKPKQAVEMSGLNGKSIPDAFEAALDRIYGKKEAAGPGEPVPAADAGPGDAHVASIKHWAIEGTDGGGGG